MNQIRAIQQLNKKELENGIPPEASWHADYRDTAFVYFGGLPYELSEGDIIVIFSQFGEPVFIKLARDKETGKSKGFGWLKYEDQRSTDLAVDNLGGANILGRIMRVDHARYKPRDDEDPEEGLCGWKDMLRMQGKKVPGSKVEGEEEDEEDEEEDDGEGGETKEEAELKRLVAEHDEEDPMKEFFVSEKRKEVEDARRRRHDNSKRERRRDKDEQGRRSRPTDSRERHRQRDRTRDDDPGQDSDRERRGRKDRGKDIDLDQDRRKKHGHADDDDDDDDDYRRNRPTDRRTKRRDDDNKDLKRNRSPNMMNLDHPSRTSEPRRRRDTSGDAMDVDVEDDDDDRVKRRRPDEDLSRARDHSRSRHREHGEHGKRRRDDGDNRYDTNLPPRSKGC